MLLSVSITSVAEDINSKIEVTISNIDKSKGGNLIILVFKDDNFPSYQDKAIAKRTFKVHQDKQIVIFSANDLPHELAFKVLHDEDVNDRTTKNWTGIWPGEGLAFSKGQEMGFLGAPNFEDSKLTREQYLEGVNLVLDYP
jgi:uncharacterized protein (DUF2141 family)